MVSGSCTDLRKTDFELPLSRPGRRNEPDCEGGRAKRGDGESKYWLCWLAFGGDNDGIVYPNCGEDGREKVGCTRGMEKSSIV